MNKNWISVLTVFCTIAVVYLHVNGVFWSHPQGHLWISSNIIECLFYFAVPCFFMISGFTLIDYRKRYDTMTFLKRRVVRVVIPFIFWSLILFCLYHKKNFFNSFISNKIEYIYWFFPELIVCYISIIFFSLIPHKIVNFTWLVVWAFLSFSVFDFFKKAGLLHIPNKYAPPIMNQYLLFVLLGYILGKVDLSKRKRLFLYLLGFIGLLLHCVGTIYLTPMTGTINRTFKGYNNFPSVFYASAVFVWFKYQNWNFIFKYKLFRNLLKIIIECSLSVYLVHRYFISKLLPFLFDKLGIDRSIFNTDSYRIIAPIIIVISICFIVKLISKLIPSRLYCLLGYKKLK